MKWSKPTNAVYPHLVSFLNSNEAGKLGDNGEAGAQLNDIVLPILFHNLTP